MTAVAICNRALAVIGESPNITSIAPPEGSVHAQQCATLYAAALEFVTESRRWTHTDRRTALSKVQLASPVADPALNIITLGVAHGLIVGNPVSFELSVQGAGSLPAPLVVGTTYYVGGTTTTQISLTEATDGLGAVIDLTTAGTGEWRIFKESDRAGADYMYALPSDCMTERNIVPPGMPDDWPNGVDGLLGASYDGLGAPVLRNGVYYPSISASGYDPSKRLPCKRAVNAGGELVLYTNVCDAELVYSCFVTDTTQWPPMFKEAVVFYLAGLLGGATRRESKIVDWCFAKAQQFIGEAARVDAQRVTSHESRPYVWHKGY